MSATGETRSYTLPELAELSAIDYRTLHNWQKRGMLRVSGQVANGSGSVNRFDETDALQILLLAELRRSGVEIRVLERIADQVWELVRSMQDHHLLVVSDDSAALSSEAEILERLRGARPSHVLPVSSARAALEGLRAAA